MHNLLAHLGEFAVSTALRRQVDNDRARSHTLDLLPRYQHRRLLARYHRRGYNNVALGDHPAEQFTLALIERLVLRLGIAAGILRVGCFDGELHETSAEALHLLFHYRP